MDAEYKHQCLRDRSLLRVKIFVRESITWDSSERCSAVFSRLCITLFDWDRSGDCLRPFWINTKLQMG